MLNDITIFYEKIKLIALYNKLLRERTNKGKYIYSIIAILFMFISSYVCYYLLFIEFNFLEVFFYLYIVMNLQLSIFRFETDTIILPEYLYVFSTSNSLFYKYLLYSSMLDIKTGIFILPMLLIMYRNFSAGWTVGFLSIIVLISFYFLIEIWINTGYLLIKKYLKKYKRNAQTITGLLILFFLVFGKIFDLNLLGKYPIIGWVCKSIQFAQDGLWLSSMFYFFLIILFILFGFWLGAYMIRKV